MTAPALSLRLLAALGITQQDISHQGELFVAGVDHTDRRYRDAIKAGAHPIDPPATIANHRVARLADRATNTTLTIRSPLPDRG